MVFSGPSLRGSSYIPSYSDPSIGLPVDPCIKYNLLILTGLSRSENPEWWSSNHWWLSPTAHHFLFFIFLCNVGFFIIRVLSIFFVSSSVSTPSWIFVFSETWSDWLLKLLVLLLPYFSASFFVVRDWIYDNLSFTVLAGLSFVFNVIILILDVLFIKVFVVQFSCMMSRLLFSDLGWCGRSLNHRLWVCDRCLGDDWFAYYFSLDLCLTNNVCFLHFIKSVELDPLACWVIKLRVRSYNW